MKSGDLIGKQVVGSGGWTIGKVKELIFDVSTWRIGSFEVELEKAVADEYQMKKLLSRTTIHVDVASVHSVGDHIILSITKPQLQDLLSYKKEELSRAANT